VNSIIVDSMMSLAERAVMARRTDARHRRPDLEVMALVLSCALFAPVLSQAQTLTQALAEAYNTNPQLLAQRALLRETDEQVPQALANWRPTVNFTGQVGGARSAFTTPSKVTAGGLTTYNTFYENSLNLQVTQPVYSGGRTVAQTRQAINLVE
jgi:outer membrane protein